MTMGIKKRPQTGSAPAPKRQCRPPFNPNMVGIACDHTGLPVIGKPIAAQPGVDKSKRGKGKDKTAMEDNVNKENSGIKPKKQRKRTHRARKERKRLYQTEKKESKPPVASDPYATYTGNAVTGNPGRYDNEFHMSLLLEPEVETSHSAALLTEITGMENFDFEIDSEN